MRIAIPLAHGKLAAHFGHCEQFALVDVDEESRSIVQQETQNPPDHEPGVLPQWLSGLGADVIIAGGMGRRAQDLFARQGISVLVGAPSEAPEALVESYLSESLVTGENMCDH